MSYTGYKPLPRFPLEEDSLDASEVSETSELPASGRRRIVVRKKQEIAPPEEVAIEDILLETYIEEPRRAAPPAPHTERMLSTDRDVDALLAMTPSAMTPTAMTPSVAPVAMSSIEPPPAPSRGGVVAIALVMVAAVAGFGATFVASRSKPRPPPVAASHPRVAVVVGAKAAEPKAVSVDALPRSAIDPTMTVVTFPSTAAGHRVYVDGVLVGSGEERATVRCGKHAITIGSRGKARAIELPCGEELLVE